MKEIKVGFESVVRYLPEEIQKRSDFAYLDPVKERTMPREMIEKMRELLPEEVRHFKGKDAMEVMSVEVAGKALKSAGLKAADIDYIICGMGGGSAQRISSGALVHYKLGFKAETPVLNISDACASFLDSTDTAWNLVKSGECRRVLVIGAASLTNGEENTDLTSFAGGFGDGAVAAIVSSQNLKCEFLSHHHETYGEAYHSACIIVKPIANPELAVVSGTKNQYGTYFDMKDMSFPEVAGRQNYLTGSLDKAVKKANLKLTDLDMVICHHIGDLADGWTQSLVEAGLSANTFQNLQKKFGNTAYTDLILDLVEFWEQGKIKKDAIVALWVPGSGIQLSMLVLRWLV